MSYKSKMDTSQHSSFYFFTLKVLKDETFLKFYGIRFNIFGYIFNSFLIVGIKRLKLPEVVKSLLNEKNCLLL